MVKIIKAAVILSALALAACQLARAPTQPAATPELPTRPPATLAPAYTPTQIPPTRVPTYTPRPTFTPRPTLSALDIAAGVLTRLSVDEDHAYSPNGYCEWKRILAWPMTELAQMEYSYQYFTYVTVICGNQDKPWVLEKKWTEEGLGYPLSSLLGWSADGKYAYFYDEIIPDGCQPPGGFQQDLRRVDLATGEILSFPISWTGGMALSPDTSKVIYYDRQAAMVGVFDLASKVELRFPIELPKSITDWFSGEFTWSPDGQSALFIIQYGDACFPSGVSVRRVDLVANPAHPSRGNVYILLERQDASLSILEWTQPDRALISLGGEKYWLYPDSGNIGPLYNQP